MLDNWDEKEEVGEEFKVVELRTRWWSCDRRNQAPRGRRSLLIAICAGNRAYGERSIICTSWRDVPVDRTVPISHLPLAWPVIKRARLHNGAGPQQFRALVQGGGEVLKSGGI